VKWQTFKDLEASVVEDVKPIRSRLRSRREQGAVGASESRRNLAVPRWQGLGEAGDGVVADFRRALLERMMILSCARDIASMIA
jgi:hypothetical protein